MVAALKKIHPKVLVEIGGYCGYSALTFAANTPADTAIYTVEINQHFADIARKILDHTGLGKKVTFFIGDVQSSQGKLKALGRIDFLFIDHIKNAYLSDFKIIEALGVIQSGSVVVGDNIIEPGSPTTCNTSRSAKTTTVCCTTLTSSTEPSPMPCWYPSSNDHLR